MGKKQLISLLGVRAEFKNIPWDELISFEPLYRDEVDMLISGITITPDLKIFTKQKKLFWPEKLMVFLLIIQLPLN